MKTLLITLTMAVLSIGAAQAQSYKYNNIRKDYVFDDGFGIPQSKLVPKQGEVRVTREEVIVDGVTYTADEKGVFRNAKGKAVDLSFSYKGDKLIAVRISTGHIINNYMLQDPQQDVVVQK